MGTRIAVVGAGIFGVTAALSLRSRGHAVALFDPGPVPHPLAESTDISKIVRLDYGADEAYTALMEEALPKWRAWNASWERPLFHETGVLFLARGTLEPGGFEFESQRLLAGRRHPIERLDADSIRRRFPAWNTDVWSEGYFNPQGGFAESGRVVSALLADALVRGVDVRGNEPMAGLIERSGEVAGLRLASGARYEADEVVVAAGAWTPALVPELAASFRTVGQPVFHFAPDDRERYASAVFPVFAADIARTGFYGFPVTPEGLVKIANHGAGRAMDPGSVEARQVTKEEEERVRTFLISTFPRVAPARLAATRVCVYCDTLDEHFWIARFPGKKGLTVATGGSGHAFKFAPVLGDLTADAVESRANPALERFRHRPEIVAPKGEEAARNRA